MIPDPMTEPLRRPPWMVVLFVLSLVVAAVNVVVFVWRSRR